MRNLKLRALEDRDWTRTFVICLAIAFIFHLLAAIFSVGFYHTDEHFQILEFLNYKLGRSQASDLAVEFSWKMRSWAQPGIYFAITRGFQALGDNNPFHWVFVFRFFSSLLGWLSLAGLSLLSYEWFDDARLRKSSLYLVAFLWYLPAFHARHSSESLSSSVFYLAVAAFFLSAEIPCILTCLGVGLLFGLSFLLRFQMAFLELGMVAYALFAKRLKLTGFLAISLAALAVVGLGVCLDHWGYGVWTFSPWNYIRYNLVLGHVHDVDTQPVWDFFTKTLTETFPGLGFALLFSFVLGWIFRPFHLLSAITLPLYLIHSVIGHKELRFIFPIADTGPFLAFLALTARSRAGEIWRGIFWSKPGRIIWRVLVVLNFIALIPTTLLPCWPPARLFSQIYAIKARELPNAPMEILYKDKNPFEILGIPLGYYRPDQTSSTHISSFTELNERIAASQAPVWFFEVGFELPEEAGLARTECKPVAQSMPDALVAIVRWEPVRPLTRRVTNWVLYRCEAMPRSPRSP